MEDFDKVAFEQLMSEAVSMHGQRHYSDALALSFRAYSMAPEGSFEQGRAARDVSARHDRMDQPKDAEYWAEKAYKIHDDLVQGMVRPTREAFRERSVSAMYVGVSGLRKVIASRRVGEEIDATETLGVMRQTWADIQIAKQQASGVNSKVDQYEINAARRVSIAESLIGSKKTGIKIGSLAVRLAFWSESPKLDTSTPNLSLIRRTHAKTKAFLGGISALGVGILSVPRFGLSRKLATTIASRTL